MNRAKIALGHLYLARLERILGELLVRLSFFTGRLAGKLLFRAQWGYGEPEWFDHRLHLLDPERWFSDYWTASADNILKVLPLEGRMLNLCSGDGFYDYWFYRKRASDIECIEYNKEVFDFAMRHHAHSKIQYHFGNVLDFPLKPSYYDVVCIRGAIEHFSPADQIIIFKKSFAALKDGGFFCGDTPAKKIQMDKQLPSHEYEWSDEEEMRQCLGKVFSTIESWTIRSADRTTLFWRCQK